MARKAKRGAARRNQRMLATDDVLEDKPGGPGLGNGRPEWL